MWKNSRAATSGAGSHGWTVPLTGCEKICADLNVRPGVVAGGQLVRAVPAVLHPGMEIYEL